MFVIIFCLNSYGQHDYKKKASDLLREMTLEEKIGQLCQYVGEPSNQINAPIKNEDERVHYILGISEKAELIKQGKIGSFLKVPTVREANLIQSYAMLSRLKIPLLIGTDAMHGHGMYQSAATIFPTEIGIASSFDTSLARKIAQYTAKEMRATGNHWTFSPNIEVARDPRWGRFGETFGEDPYLVGRMGVAMIDGYQGKDLSSPDNVLACAKHFVGGGISFNGLNGAPADISERTLQEIFFPPFKAAIDAGVYTIMPAHNEINGIPCHAHKGYLTDLIRDQWNFKGFFISDWMDIERLHTTHKIAESLKDADKIAVLAGMDMHMHGAGFFENIQSLVEEKAIPLDRIDMAVSKILEAKFLLGLFDHPFVDTTQANTVVLNREHTDFALEAALKSIVLLKNNNNILPLHKNISSIFVTGPNANNQTILGDWAVHQPDEHIVTIIEGIRNAVSPETHINFLPCPDDVREITQQHIDEAVRLAKQSEIAIIAAGENSMRFSSSKTSGENLDKPAIDFPGNQLPLIQAIVETGTPVIIVMINGSPVSSEWVVANAAALLEAWEPGMKGGQAVADILFGEYNPGGKLPVTFPRSVGHVQNFYNYKPSAFHRGKFFNAEVSSLFEFGYGLSYTTFAYGNLQLPEKIGIKDHLQLSVEVTNTGGVKGDEVVLVFVNDNFSSVTTPVKKLVGFSRVSLDPREKKKILFTIQNNDLMVWDINMNKIIEPGTFDIIIGLNALRKSFVVE